MSTAHEWDIPALEKFTDWFSNQQFEEGSTLFQLGDVFDKAANYGETIRLVTKFFKIASEKFESVYVIGGNHDLGLHKKSFQYATNYLSSSFNNIYTLYKEVILNLDKTEIAILPFQKINGEILEKYYSEKLPAEFYNCDITCGHVALKEEGTFFGGIDVAQFNPRTRFIMGHIHSRNGKYKDCYTGSVLPNKINEAQTELPRALIEYDTITKLYSDIPIPEILKFEIDTLGSNLTYKKDSNDDLIHLYTIKNCKHLHEARNHYTNNYIYNVEKPKQVDTVTSVSSSNILMTTSQALNMMIKENKMILKRKTLQVVRELLRT
jgi:DNA repair exonuclease SbcCD nuclease subunit